MATAIMLDAPCDGSGHDHAMRDWAVDYILHILQTKGWSANRLAQMAGVSSTTISRPIAQNGTGHRVSRQTLAKIAKASGVDPTPFVPPGFSENSAEFAGVTIEAPKIPAVPLNSFQVVIDGRTATIHAHVDAAGVATLIERLELVRKLLR